MPARAIPGFCHGRGRKRRLQEGSNRKGTKGTDVRGTLLLRSCLRPFWTSRNARNAPASANVEDVISRSLQTGRSFFTRQIKQSPQTRTRPFLVRHCSHTISQSGRILTSYFLIFCMQPIFLLPLSFSRFSVSILFLFTLTLQFTSTHPISPLFDVLQLSNDASPLSAVHLLSISRTIDASPVGVGRRRTWSLHQSGWRF